MMMAGQKRVRIICPNCKTYAEYTVNEGEYYVQCLGCEQRNTWAIRGEGYSGLCSRCLRPLDEPWHVYQRADNIWEFIECKAKL